MTASRQGQSLIPLDQGVVTATPAGKVAPNVVATVAEWERDMIALGTNAGLAAARTKGARLGAPLRQDPGTLQRIQAFAGGSRSGRDQNGVWSSQGSFSRIGVILKSRNC